MSLNYSVQATVFDILQDTPRKEDVFLVDTNIWFWATYSNASHSSSNNSHHNEYVKYLDKALAVNAKIHYCGLSFSELAHTIEKTEFEIYKKFNSSTVNIKEFRHNNKQQRQGFVSELKSAWNQVKSMATPLPIIIDGLTTDQALQRICNEQVDGYDIFIIESMKKNNVIKIITHDGDYTTVDGIHVVTCNNGALVSARKHGKFMKR